jgi:hypothetical protein
MVVVKDMVPWVPMSTGPYPTLTSEGGSERVDGREDQFVAFI